MPIKETSRRAGRGFSLLELLLVLSLAPIVFFVVYSNFATGVRLWQRLQVATPEEDRAIFLIKARADFQNMRRFSALPFMGTAEETTFAAGIEAPKALGGSRGIGQVHYYYDSSARVILRDVRDYSQVHEGKDGVRTAMLKGVSSFSISYLAKEKTSAKYEWAEEFQPAKPGELPLAVRLAYTPSGSPETIEQTFFVGAGGEVS